MPYFERVAVLLAADEIGSPALQRARQLCVAFGARLHLLVFAHSRMVEAASLLLPGLARQGRQGFLERAAHVAQQESQALRGCGIETDWEVLWSSGHDARLRRRLQALSPDLLVKNLDAGGASGWRSIDRLLLNHSAAAVLLAHPEPSAAGAVAAAIDMDRLWPCEVDFGERLAATAGRIAAAEGADLELLQAGSRDGAAAEDGFEQLGCRLSVPATRRHRLGRPTVPAILDYLAAHPARLAVIGAPLRTLGQRLLHGRHAERIALLAGCDVLALRP